MKTNKAGFDLIKEFEGYHRALPNGDAEAYLDPVGVWTIGWGSIRLNGRPVRRGDVISAKLAEELLNAEVAGFENDVAAMVEVPLNENQFSALVSLCYNIGAGGFAGSTMRRLLNAGDYAGCAEAMLRWNKGAINGQLVELPVLTRRRKAERELFLTPVGTKPAPPEPVEPPKSGAKPYTPCPVPIEGWPKLSRNLKGESVYELQCALIGLGYLRGEPDLSKTMVGDYFNEHVEHAVKTFQLHEDLAIDGIVGPATRERIELVLKLARGEKPAEPKPEAGVATLRTDGTKTHTGAWSGLRSFILTVGDSEFSVASGAPGRQTLRKATDPNSVPGSLEPIPQGVYTFDGAPEFVLGNDRYEGSWGDGLGPVWHGLINGQKMRRGDFGAHLDSNIGTERGSAGCLVFPSIDDLRRYVAAWRKAKPTTLSVEYGL